MRSTLRCTEELVSLPPGALVVAGLDDPPDELDVRPEVIVTLGVPQRHVDLPDIALDPFELCPHSTQAIGSGRPTALIERGAGAAGAGRSSVE